MTNQAILQPKENDRYLAVVVPKESYNHCISGGDIMYSNRFNNAVRIPINLKNKFKIIGLLSQMTEEQAKEILVNNVHGHITKYYIFMDYMNRVDGFPEWNKSLQSLIESSGLTYTSEQDVLIIKIN